MSPAHLDVTLNQHQMLVFWIMTVSAYSLLTVRGTLRVSGRLSVNSRKPRGRSRSRKPLHSSSPVQTDPDTASGASRPNRTANYGGSKADTLSRGGAHEVAGTSEDDLNLKGPSSKRQAKKGSSRAFEPRKLLPQHPLSPVVEGVSFDSSHSTTKGSVKHNLSTPDVAHSSSEARSDKILTVVEVRIASSSPRRIAVSEEGDDNSTPFSPVTIKSAQSCGK